MSAAPAARGNPSAILTISRRPRLRLALVAAAWACSACSSSPASGSSWWNVLSPYKLEVVQGNVVTKEQAALIRPGMSRNEVRDVLGSPLLTDVFHADRWDYVFSIRRQGAAAQQRAVSVLFKNDKVAEFKADELPAERDFDASISTTRKAKAPELSLSPAQIQALPLPAAPSASAGTAGAASSATPRSYPPLESQ